MDLFLDIVQNLEKKRYSIASERKLPVRLKAKSLQPTLPCHTLHLVFTMPMVLGGVQLLKSSPGTLVMTDMSLTDTYNIK